MKNPVFIFFISWPILFLIALLLPVIAVYLVCDTILEIFRLFVPGKVKEKKKRFVSDFFEAKKLMSTEEILKNVKSN